MEPFSFGERRVGVEEFALAYARSKAHLIRTAALITGDDDVAADVVAEVFARVLPRWRAGNVLDLDGYLYRCVVNECISAIRRRRAVEWRPGSTRDHAEQIADYELVAQLLATLKPKVRAMVVLRFFGDLTEAQTAKIVGVPVGTVKSSISRALESLRGSLTKGEVG
ncbi:MAG: sigma-70 family RNA polymerase sigma factor [Acidimicrobiales bacterium]